MGDQAQLLPGTLDLLILRAISLGPLHGYRILLHIEQISGSALLIEKAALYPGPFRLVRQGLLKACWGASENNRCAKFLRVDGRGPQAPARVGNSHRPGRKAHGSPAGGAGRPLRLLVFGSAAGLLLGILSSRVLALIVYQATPRDPLVLTGVVVAMALLGLVATWIPSVDPMTLLREE
ncbi:MAG: helix-turn-helix transcriptional regulator [Terracidiphilus sp.]